MCQRTSLLTAAAAVSVMACVIVLSVAAQKPSGTEGGGLLTAPMRPEAMGGPFPGFGQGDGLADVQAKIKASDEEWKVIGPKLRRVMAASAAVEANIDGTNSGGVDFMPGGPGLGRRGGPGRGPGGPGGDSFAGPGEGGPFSRGGPGPGGFGRGGPLPEDFGPGGPGPDGSGPGAFGPDVSWASGPRLEGETGSSPTQSPALGNPTPSTRGPGEFGPGGAGGRGLRGFGRGGRGGFGGPPGFGGSGAVMQKLVELQTTLADPNTTVGQIKEKLATVREAHQKAQAELIAARKDLLELLTLDQEAALVSLGYLD